jgi:Domain of unknown function (DUF4397)
MKTNKIIISTLLLGFAAITLFTSCEKKYEVKTAVFATSDDMAQLRIVHAAPFFRRVFGRQDSFHVYVNDQKVNNTFLTYGSIFPAQTTNPYIAIKPGTTNIRFVQYGVVLIDSSTITALSKTTEAGKKYTLIINDSLANNKENQQMWMVDNFTTPDTSFYNVRFVNTVLNDVANVDVYSFRRAANIFTNVSKASISQFLRLPSSTTSDTISVRTTGTATEIARLNTMPVNSRRSYTIYYRGDATTGTAKPRVVTYVLNE